MGRDDTMERVTILVDIVQNEECIRIGGISAGYSEEIEEIGWCWVKTFTVKYFYSPDEMLMGME